MPVVHAGEGHQGQGVTVRALVEQVVGAVPVNLKVLGAKQGHNRPLDMEEMRTLPSEISPSLSCGGVSSLV